MTMTRRAALGFGTALGLLAAAPAFAQEVTLRLHQFLPAQANVPAHILDVWADAVEADSEGRIKVERYPAMQLGGTPPELIDQAIDGVADVIWTVAGYTPGRFPQVEVFEQPFISPDAEATSRAFWTLAEERMMDTDFAAFTPLGLWVHGPGVIHTNVPVEEASDLEGVSLRAPTRMTTTLFTELGASAIGMPVPAVPESVSRGVIDGAVIPWEVVPALKLQELVDNHTEFPGNALYTTAFIFAMNSDVYNGLPDDLKAVIDANSGLEFSAFAGRTMQEYDAPGRASAEELGNNIISLTEEQAATWMVASDGVTAAWVAEMDEAGLDGTGLLAEAQRLIAENMPE